MQAMSPTKKSTAGFTIVELAAVITIMPLVIALFIYAVLASFTSTSSSKLQLSLDSDAQNAMQVIERDVRFSKSFETAVSSPFSDPYGANNNGTANSEAWSHKGVPNSSATSRVLLLSTAATTQSSLGNTRSPVFTDSVSYNCSTELSYNPELAYMIIYFVRSGTLYRRILTDTTTTICSGQTVNQKQSCPPELSPWTAYSTICKVKDEKIATNVSTFSIDYYTERAASPISDEYTSSDPDVLDIADDAQITLTTSKPFAATTLTGTVTLRIAKVNK